MQRATRLFALVFLSFLAGCGGCGRSGITLPAHQHLQALVVVPDHATMFVGQRLAFRAVAAFDDGPARDLAPDEVAWSSSDEAALVFEGAVAVAHAAAGSLTITADSAGLSASASVTISPSPVNAFEVSPSRAVVSVGETVALHAAAKLEDGTSLDLTNAASGTVWASADPSHAEVSPDGVVKGLAAGIPVEISAKNGAFSGTCLVRVTAGAVEVVSLDVRPARLVLEAGSTGAVHAIASLSDGSELDVTDSPAITWSSSSPEAVEVDAEGGLVAHQAATHVAISASLEGRRSAALVDVTEARLVSLELTPKTLSLALGADAQLTATGRYSDGHIQPLTADPRLFWRSDDPLTARVDAGRVHAVAAGGPVAIHASLGAIEAVATVTVLPAKLTGLSLAPVEGEVLLGGTLPLKVLGQFDDGSTRDLSATSTGTRYEADPSGFLAIDAQGIVRGDRIGGPVSVLASNAGFEARAAIRVVARPDQLVALAFTPADVQLDVGQGRDLTLIGTYGDGHTENLTAAARGTVYSSGDHALVDVDQDGRVTAFALGGPVAISGANGGLFATAHVTVAPPPPVITSIDVDPRLITGKVGDSVRLRVTATLSDGSSRDVTAALSGTTYTLSGDPSVARASADGVVSLTASGNAALVITNGAARTFANIQVEARTLIDMRIQPGRLDLPVGIVDRVTVLGIFSDGTTIDLTAPETGTIYASAKPNVATVDASGHVQALTVGNSTISAANGGLIRRVGVRVREAQISGVALSPPVANVVAGRTLQLTCTAMLDTGRLVDVTAGLSGTVYVSANPAIATIGPDGLLKGVASGRTQVSCINRGKVGASDVNVAAPVADEVRVSPSAARLPKGRILPLSVTVLFSDGTVRDASGAGAGTLYFAANPAVAPVSVDGVVTGLSEGGPVSVTALVAGSTNDVAITVVPPEVDSLACRPASLSLNAGQTGSIAIDATWSDGRVSAVTATDGLVFRSQEAAVATVTDAGLVSAVAAGRTQVFAYLGGAVARCPVEVFP